MTDTLILGRGPLGRAIEAALVGRGGPPPRLFGRPAGIAHQPADLAGADVVVDASIGPAVQPNVEVALAAGCRRFVLATTGWDDDGDRVERLIRDRGAAAVVAPNLSLGAAVFLRLVREAAGELAALGGFDPYVLEWHRRGKRDRPSGTARRLLEALGPDTEVASVRAGASPGMHLVGFDSAGETVELRLTARDRSAYAAGALAAVDWLRREPRRPGFHPFDAVVDDLVTPRPLAATA